MDDKINCLECGRSCHSISLHLKKNHAPGSMTPMTLEQYVSKYPEGPLLSDAARQRLDESRRAQEAASPAQETVPASSDRSRPLHELFGLGTTPAARNTRTGEPIPVSICQQTGFEEHIPKMDPNYVYQVDLLKKVLCCIETGRPIYLYGHAGVGKTSLFRQVCGATRRRMVRVQHSVNLEESHVVGQWTVRKHKDEETGQLVSETLFQLGMLPLAMIHGWTYVADEYDRSHASVLSIYQAVLEGEALVINDADEEHRIIQPHPDFRFVATGNTNGSGDETGLYQATLMQDAATLERFMVERVDYMPRAQEVAVVRGQTRLVKEHAEQVVDFCTRIREQYPSKISLTAGPRVAIGIASMGLMLGDLKKGVEMAFANRLPESERIAALDIAQRIFG